MIERWGRWVVWIELVLTHFFCSFRDTITRRTLRRRRGWKRSKCCSCQQKMNWGASRHYRWVTLGSASGFRRVKHVTAQFMCFLVFLTLALRTVVGLVFFVCAWGGGNIWVVCFCKKWCNRILSPFLLGLHDPLCNSLLNTSSVGLYIKVPLLIWSRLSIPCASYICASFALAPLCFCVFRWLFFSSL